MFPTSSNCFGTRRCRARICIFAAATAFLLLLLGAVAQSALTNSPAATNVPPQPVEQKSWAFGASIYGYIVPESQDYVQPTITADHGLWHFEARYNYEQLKTGSIWAGCNFGAGKTLE